MLRKAVDVPHERPVGDLVEDVGEREEVTDVDVDALVHEVSMLQEDLELVLCVHSELINLRLGLEVVVDEGIELDRIVVHLLKCLVVDSMSLSLQLRDRVIVYKISDDVLNDLFRNVADEVEFSRRDEEAGHDSPHPITIDLPNGNGTNRNCLLRDSAARASASSNF